MTIPSLARLTLHWSECYPLAGVKSDGTSSMFSHSRYIYCSITAMISLFTITVVLLSFFTVPAVTPHNFYHYCGIT